MGQDPLNMQLLNRDSNRPGQMSTSSERPEIPVPTTTPQKTITHN